jgi:hypothetical protein
MPCRGNDLDVLHANAAQAIRHEISRAFYIRSVLRSRADAGDAQELLQLVQQAILMLIYVGVGRRGHT